MADATRKDIIEDIATKFVALVDAAKSSDNIFAQINGAGNIAMDAKDVAFAKAIERTTNNKVVAELTELSQSPAFKWLYDPQPYLLGNHGYEYERLWNNSVSSRIFKLDTKLYDVLDNIKDFMDKIVEELKEME